jgi:hypothetical protein
LPPTGFLVAEGRLVRQLKPLITMMKSILKLGAVSLLALAIAAMPAQLLAQTTNASAAAEKPATAKKESATKKKGAHPFHGKLAAVDKVALTIKVGKSVYQITSQTRFTKDGKPATLEAGVVGEPVSGYVKPAADGKMAATTVRFGAKAEKKSRSKKKES